MTGLAAWAAARPLRLTFLLSFAVFAVMAAPGITWMDPGELAAAAYSLGGSHPPGHPAHSMLGKLATLVPVGEIGFRLNLLSAAAMAAAIAGVMALARALIPGETVAATAAAILAALSPVVQTNATRTEVYAPAAALVVWAMVACVRFVRADAQSGAADGRLVMLAAGACGLAAAFHPLIAISAAAPMALAIAWAGRARLRRLAPAAVFVAVLGLVVYAYLPIRANAASPPLLMWGDPSTLTGLIDVLVAPQYQGNFSTDGGFARFAALMLLCGEGMGAGLLWGGLIGLGFAALTGLRGAGVVIAAALTVLIAAATQSYVNPDMPGYVLPALVLAGVGLAPVSGAVIRVLPDAWREAGWKRHVAAAVILTPIVGFSALAPVVRAEDGGFRRSDDPMRFWSHTVELMPPGPGVFFANSDDSLFAAAYERLVAGGRPDIAIANAELCRDRWFVAHLKRLLPDLYVPFIDDGVPGRIAERLVAGNAGAPVAGDQPGIVRRVPDRASVPFGWAYRYGTRPADPAALPPAAAPPAFEGGVGARIARRMGLARADYEIELGRLTDAAVAAGLAPIPGSRDHGRPALRGFIPAISDVFMSEPWQVALVEDELAWLAGQPGPQSRDDSLDDSRDSRDSRNDSRDSRNDSRDSRNDSRDSRRARLVPERHLHALWRRLLTSQLSADSLPDHLAEIATLGRDAELATARMLVAVGRESLGEAALREMIASRGADHVNLVMLGSLIGNRGTPGALAEAEALFAQAARSAPDQVEPLFRLGLAQAKQNQREAAKQSWQRALALDPNRRDIAALIRKLDAK